MVGRTMPFTKSLALGKKSTFYPGSSNRTPVGKGMEDGGEWGRTYAIENYWRFKKRMELHHEYIFKLHYKMWVTYLMTCRNKINVK